jgi:hypothetical protein
MRFINRTCVLYFAWILLHFAATHMYPRYCAELSFQGLFLSPFMSSTPHCTAMRWMIVQGSNSISAMWLVIASSGMDLLTMK